MKVTKEYLKKVIKEELRKITEENENKYEYLTAMVVRRHAKKLSFHASLQSARNEVAETKELLGEDIQIFKLIKNEIENTTSNNLYLVLGMAEEAEDPEDTESFVVGVFKNIQEARKEKISHQNEDQLSEWSFFIYRNVPTTDLKSIPGSSEIHTDDSSRNVARPTLRIVKEKMK